MVVSNFVDFYNLYVVNFDIVTFLLKNGNIFCWPWTLLHHYHYLQLGHVVILIFALSVIIHQFVDICEIGACEIDTYILGLLCWVTWLSKETDLNMWSIDFVIYKRSKYLVYLHIPMKNLSLISSQAWIATPFCKAILSMCLKSIWTVMHLAIFSVFLKCFSTKVN